MWQSEEENYFNLKKSCENCIKGTSIGVNADILCREKGAVSPEYVCMGYRSKPQPKSVKEMNYKCIHCDYFNLAQTNSNDSTAMGFCMMFSVRQYNGKERNACSKLIKKTLPNLEVS